METTPYYFLTGAGFILLTLVMYLLVFRELSRALQLTNWEESRKKKIYQRSLFALIGWTIFISAFSIAGFFSNFSSFPPRLFITLVVPLFVILRITFTKSVKEILANVSPKTLINLQAFRLFVEILLWALFVQNLLPIQMTFEGRNFDILPGIAAPFAAYFIAKSRAGVIIWNIFSLTTLLNIIVIAILSLPSPFQVFTNEPANRIVTYFPFIWLPGLLVPLAYGLSFLSLKQLAAKRSVSNTNQSFQTSETVS